MSGNVQFQYQTSILTPTLFLTFTSSTEYDVYANSETLGTENYFWSTSTINALSNNHLLKLINTESEFKDLEKDYISILNNPESIMHAIKY